MERKMEKIKVAVIGATGAVGQVFMWMLADHPMFEVDYITASAARANQAYGSTVHWLLPFEMPHAIRQRVISEFNAEAMKERGVEDRFSVLCRHLLQPRLNLFCATWGFSSSAMHQLCATMMMFLFSFLRPTWKLFLLSSSRIPPEGGSLSPTRTV